MSDTHSCFFPLLPNARKNKSGHTINYIWECCPQRESMRERKGKRLCALYRMVQMNQIKHTGPTCIWHLLVQTFVTGYLFLCVPINMKKLCSVLRGSEYRCPNSCRSITFVYYFLILGHNSTSDNLLGLSLKF